MNNLTLNYINGRPVIQVKKNDSFSFYLSIGVLLVFLYLIAAYTSVRQCVIIICRCPQNIIEISLSRKNVHRNKHSNGEVKGKGAIFFNWPYPMYTIFVTKKLGIEGEFSNAQMIIYLRRH
jgi:hypothetical protein